MLYNYTIQPLHLNSKHMTKYECTKCGRQVVVASTKSILEMPCCNKETASKFIIAKGKVIIPVAALPKAMIDTKPLPPSVPVAGPVTK